MNMEDAAVRALIAVALHGFQNIFLKYRSCTKNTPYASDVQVVVDTLSSIAARRKHTDLVTSSYHCLVLFHYSYQVSVSKANDVVEQLPKRLAS